MVRDPGFHRWRHPEGAVNPAEVIVREVERKRGLQIFPLLRKRIGEPGKALAPLAKRSILALGRGIIGSRG